MSLFLTQPPQHEEQPERELRTRVHGAVLPRRACDAATTLHRGRRRSRSPGRSRAFTSTRTPTPPTTARSRCGPTASTRPTRRSSADGELRRDRRRSDACPRPARPRAPTSSSADVAAVHRLPDPRATTACGARGAYVGQRPPAASRWSARSSATRCSSSSLDEPNMVKQPMVYLVGAQRALDAPMKWFWQREALIAHAAGPLRAAQRRRVGRWPELAEHQHRPARYDTILRLVYLHRRLSGTSATPGSVELPDPGPDETPEADVDRTYAACGSRGCRRARATGSSPSRRAPLNRPYASDAPTRCGP